MELTQGLKPNLDRRAGRMLSRGRLTATVTSHKTGQHITIHAKCCTNDKDAPYGKKWPGCSKRRNQPRPTHVFLTAGEHDKVGTFYPQTGKFYADRNADPARVYAAKLVLMYATEDTAFQSEVVESDNCGKCGRTLTDPVSIARGIGPECYGQETGSSHELKNDPERRAEQLIFENEFSTKEELESIGIMTEP